MLVKKTVNGVEYTFICALSGTRNGFKHTADLYRGEDIMVSTHINYLNRTWESYQFQSVMRNAVHTLQTRLVESAIEDARGNGKLKRGQREEITEATKQTPQYKEYEDLLSTL